jgi:hypothetical protein
VLLRTNLGRRSRWCPRPCVRARRTSAGSPPARPRGSPGRRGAAPTPLGTAEAAPVEHVRTPAVLMLLLLSLLVPRRCECSGEEEGAEEDEEERNPRSASGARHCVRQVWRSALVLCGAWFCMQAEVALICSSVRTRIRGEVPRLRGGRLRAQEPHE